MSATVDRQSRQWRSPELQRHTGLAQFAVDAGAWAVAIVATTLARYEGDVGALHFGGLMAMVALAVLAQGLFGVWGGLYRHRWRYGSFDEVRALTLTDACVGVVLVVAVVAAPGTPIPRSIPFLAPFVALVISGSVRYAVRLARERSRRPDRLTARPLLVFGAGEGGAQALRAMLTNPASPWRPVALVDDDPSKRRLTISGIRVQGGRDDIEEIAARHDADAMLLAIPSLAGQELRELAGHAHAAGLQVLVVPPVSELVGPVGIEDIRPLTEADLLGRRPVELDLDAIAAYLRGRRVLVTGAGGSIGSELCRQINRFHPRELLMLDRDETALHAVQLSLEGRALLEASSLVLADIRDRGRVFEVFREHRPDIVFHAAALKHLTLLERHPSEAWKTNVVGSQHVLEAALETGVRRFVNISTDKAADPTSVLGRSKRITERLVAHAAETSGWAYVSVRFGNVLGSRGSVLAIFEAQVARGGPVTVTHQDVTRYFMTVSEAVLLTFQAAAVGHPGEVLVLDMGAPVRIVDVARRLIEQSGRPVAIEYTGLRPGEKLHETLFARDEQSTRPFHPLVGHVRVPPLKLADLDSEGWLGEDESGQELSARGERLA